MRLISFFLVFVLVSLTSAYAQPEGWDGVEKVFDKKGVPQGDMFKMTFPRNDLTVKVGEVQVETGLALTSWIGFKMMGKQAIMMGDLVLLEKEVALVTSKLADEGIKITALHNHLISSTPVVIYLHFSGEGNPEKLAGAVRSAISLTSTPMGPLSSAETANPADWAKVEAVFGKAGQKKGNLLQMSFPRKEKIEEKGMEVPSYLGVANAINLQMVGSKAAATGDFVLIGSEVNPVIKALVDHGIKITAIHSHMLFESPRLFFLHFWGYDDPENLAKGLKAALEKINLAK